MPRDAISIRAVRNPQVAVGVVAVADHRQAIRPDRDRQERADVASAVDGGGGVAGAARGVAAVATFRSPFVLS
jgi:hypothetical protein